MACFLVDRSKTKIVASGDLMIPVLSRHTKVVYL